MTYRILLVRPKFNTIVANLEPLGLEYIKGLCNDLEIQCEIYDEFQYSWLFRKQRLLNIIKKGQFNFIGFNINANTTDYVKRAAQWVKEADKNIITMAGGPEVEINYRDFCTDEFDLVYHDNGLTTLKNIITSEFVTNNLNKQTGICFKDGEEWVVKEKGRPVNGFICKPDRTAFYNGLRRNFIFMKGSFAISKASFSCPFNCSFCYCTKMNNGHYTERNLEEVFEDIESINHDKIWFVDDTFFVNKERVITFCNEVIRRGIKKQFMAYSRADFLAKNPDVLSLAYKAGFRDILVGLEAITDDVLDEYNKETSKDDNVLAIKHLHDNGIVCNGLFVLNHKSTKQDFKNLLKFIKDNNLLFVVFGIFTPYKGTDAYEEYKDRLIKYVPKRLDGAHITIMPENMSYFMFMMRFYWLHIMTWPKIFLRAMNGTLYKTRQ